MKLMFVVDSYGGRAQVLLGYQQALFFRGGDPPKRTMITVEMPGLQSDKPETVLAWLSAGNRDIPEIERKLWRVAVLDDVLYAQNWNQMVWQTSQHFAPEDFHVFADKHGPALEQRLAEVARSAGQARVRAIDKVQPTIERLAYVFWCSPAALVRDRLETMRALDEPKLTAMRRAPYAFERWLACAKTLSHPESIQAVLMEIGDALAKERAPARTHEALEAIRAVKKLRDACHPLFWKRVVPVVELPSNVEGMTIDVAGAEEVTVELGWELLDAQRMGPVVPGRSALKIVVDRKPLYIRGERKLKFRIQQAGGSLVRWGNTLTLPAGKGLADALLTADRIDTLANLDPKQAVKLAEHLALPPDHPLFDAARRVAGDPRYGRVLADLLIELLLGIDADIARRLARAQARANRR